MLGHSGEAVYSAVIRFYVTDETSYILQNIVEKINSQIFF